MPAVEVADLLIPYRPSAFDLSAIQTTAKLVQLLCKPAFVVFTAGSPNAPRVCQEAGELVDGFGTPLSRLPHRGSSGTDRDRDVPAA
jgi:chromosome partitioning protein